MDPTLQVITTIGGWGLALVLGVINLMPKKGDLENKRIDQLQEDLDAERKERKELSVKVDVLYVQIGAYRRRDLAWMTYVAVVQRGVEAGTIPPWPDLPAILEGEVQ